MKKKTGAKWCSGIAAALTAATFIGFTQNHDVESGEDTAVVAEQTDSSSTDQVLLFEEEESVVSDDSTYEEEEYQGMQPSDRRTGRS
ncbi:hypothetical protein [Domibacillus robiginosus]|uniref:hypothetical protein n=1 Tax=Domibacillus robiginosus TaxID=1071054 RepID=UPI00067BF7E9|nr:hypothetical protein [Domibacillus robiginosus]